MFTAARVALRIALRIVVTIALAATGAFAQTPEATDPDVARCAAAAMQRLNAGGVDGRKVTTIAADRANATIDRWEAPFSKADPQRVATLISVPLQLNFDDGRNPPRALATSRCGFTSGKLLVFEIVPVAMPAAR